jgi:hypothetical protein
MNIKGIKAIRNLRPKEKFITASVDDS